MKPFFKILVEQDSARFSQLLMKSLTLKYRSCVIGLYSCDGTLHLKVKFRKVIGTFKSEYNYEINYEYHLSNAMLVISIIVFLLILAPIESYSSSYQIRGVRALETQRVEILGRTYICTQICTCITI